VDRVVAAYLASDVEAAPRRVRAGSEPLFSQPLGAGSTLREWWAGLARVLGLNLLATLGAGEPNPVGCWSGSGLLQVAAEIAALEAWWATADVPWEVVAELQEAARCVREAVEVAEKCGGWVVIV
jgi:hypothetical protein